MPNQQIFHRGKRYEIRRRDGASGGAQTNDAVVLQGYLPDLLSDISISPIGLAALSDAVRDDLFGALPPWYDCRCVVEHMAREINAGRYILIQTAEASLPEESTAAEPQCALTTYVGTNITGESAVVDVQFVGAMDQINAYASSRGVEVYVVSSFREAGQTVQGAVVQPATRSNHLAGHAIDMNVRYQGTLYNSAVLSASNHGNLPEPVRGFIQDIRDDANLRWGGDFTDTDPVHIDDYLNRDEQAWLARYNACQEARRSGCG